MIRPINNSLNNNITYKGGVKNNPLLQKSLDKFSTRDLIEFKNILKRASEVKDGRLFEVFEKEVPKRPLGRGTDIKIGLKEITNGQNITLSSEQVEEFSLYEHNKFDTNYSKAIIEPLNELYPIKQPYQTIIKLRQQIKELLK